MSKEQWIATFVGTLREQSRHFLSERSIRVIATQQWETRQNTSPVDLALRWGGPTLTKTR